MLKYFQIVAASLFAVIICLMPHVSHAGTVTIQDRHFDRSVGYYLEVLSTTGDYLWPWQVESMTGWKPNSGDEFYVSDDKSYHWARFGIKNDTGSLTIAMLEIDNMMLDVVDIYLVENQVKELQKFWHSGVSLGAGAKPYPAKNFVFPFYLKQDASYEVYLKIRNDTKSFVPIRVSHMLEYVARDSLSSIFTGIVEGFVLLTVCYSLFMLFFTREKRFLLSFFFNSSLLLLLMFMGGFTGLLDFLSSGERIKNFNFFLSYMLALGIMGPFEEMFHSIGKVRSFCRHNRTIALIPIVMLGLCWLIPRETNAIICICLVASLIAIGAWLSKSIWLRGMLFLKIYFVALMAFMLCWLGNLLTRYGFYCVNFMSDSTMFYCAALVATILCSSIAWRAYLEKRSRQMSGEKRKRDSQQLFEMYHKASEGFFFTDLHGRLLSGNRTFFSLLGFENIDQFREERGPLLKLANARLQDGGDLYSQLILSGQASDGIKSEIELVCRDGSKLQALVCLAMSRLSQEEDRETIVNGTLTDISEHKSIKHRLDYIESHDRITGLANRQNLLGKLQELKEKRLKGKAGHFSDYLCFFDVDHFMVLNNSGGSEAGDEFLKELARTLLSLGYETDTVARVGGDEFCVILEDKMLDEAMEEAERIRKAVQSLRFDWENHVYSVSVSLGLVPCETSEPSEIVSMAETACVTAKQQGRNRVKLYSVLGDEVQNYRREVMWIAQLYSAIENKRFIMFRQRIDVLEFAGMENKEVCEIFVRILGENNNVLPAGTFMEIASKYGLTQRIDDWTMNALVSMIISGECSAMHRIYVALSEASLSSREFRQKVVRNLEKSEGVAKKLGFLITEELLRRLPEEVDEFIMKVRQAGSVIAIDSFMGGIDSYSFIDRIRPETIRIGCDILLNLADRDGDATLQTVILMIKKAGAKLVVNRVRNKDMDEKIRKFCFDAYQGIAVEPPKLMGQDS